MKKVISLVFSLAIMLGCIGVTACAGENGGLTWNDIPVYPGAELAMESYFDYLAIMITIKVLSASSHSLLMPIHINAQSFSPFLL